MVKLNSKVIWKDKLIKAPYCPNCGAELEIVTDPDARTVMTYFCKTCRFAE